MKKLLTLLFTFAIAFSLAMPVFASNPGAQETTKSEKKSKKEHKAKSKKQKKTKSSSTQ